MIPSCRLQITTPGHTLLRGSKGPCKVQGSNSSSRRREKQRGSLVCRQTLNLLVMRLGNNEGSAAMVIKVPRASQNGWVWFHSCLFFCCVWCGKEQKHLFLWCQCTRHKGCFEVELVRQKKFFFLMGLFSSPKPGAD